MSLVWFCPWDIGTPWIQLLSGFPAVALLTPVPLMLSLIYTGRRKLILRIAVILLMSVQLATVIPRLFPAPAQPVAGGEPAGRLLNIMSLNVGGNSVDVAAVLSEVRERRIDVLALPELGPDTLELLDKAGISGELPYRVVDVDWAGTGSGLFSRFPLDSTGRVPGSGFYQSRAVASIPGIRQGVQLTAVHVDSPRPGHTPFWRRDLQQLGELQQAVPEGAPAILLGDFNASTDHREFRELVSTGLTDAAQAAGRGLWPTWPENSPVPSFVALDHVLVSSDIGVSGFEAVSIPGTDHAAVIVLLRLPQ